MNRSVILILGLFLLFSACNKIQVIGQWQREVNANFEQGSERRNSNWGHLTFNSDSTFFIAGDHNEDESNVSTPGWHVGGDIKGNWRIEGNQLFLKPEFLQTNLYLTYEIIQLTNKRLVLLSSFDRRDTTKYIFFSRDQ